MTHQHRFFQAFSQSPRETGVKGFLKRAAAIFLAALAIAAVIGIVLLVAVFALSAAVIGVGVVAVMWAIARLTGRTRRKPTQQEGDQVLVARRTANGWEATPQ